MRPIVIFADSHLEWSAWANRPEICGDSLFSFHQIVEKACEWEASSLIGAGDIFDSPNQPEVVTRFWLECMETCHSYSIPVYTIKGQHDHRSGLDPAKARQVYDDLQIRDYPDSPSALSRHVQSLDGQYACDGLITGLSYKPQTPENLKSLYRDAPGAPILVTHQVYSRFARGKARLEDVPDRFNMVITGDFHEFHALVQPRPSGNDLIVVSPGSTCMQSIDEPADKYFLVIAEKKNVPEGLEMVISEIPGKGYQSTEHLGLYRYLLKTRRFFSVSSSKEGFTDALRSITKTPDLPDTINAPLVQVHLTGRSPELTQLAREAIGDRGHLFFKYPGSNKDNNTAQDIAPPVMYGIDRASVEAACQEIGGTPAESSLIASMLEADDLKKVTNEHFNWKIDVN